MKTPSTIRIVGILGFLLMAAFPPEAAAQQGDTFTRRGSATVTEGDEAHRADLGRSNFGVDGTGVTACVISDSVAYLELLKATDELPPGITVLAGQSGNPGSSRGTAMLEIIHDVAPGADLMFATGAGGPAQMATNIEDLAAAGCDVIAADVAYPNDDAAFSDDVEAVFQDDVIAQAVETVAGEGVLYFAAAGDDGNLNDNESGVWEGLYSGTTLPPILGPLYPGGATAHDFGGGDVLSTLTEDPQDDARFFTLQWSDSLGASGNDYDLAVLDSTGSIVVARSGDVQDGDDDPSEKISSEDFDDSGNVLVVIKKSGAADRFLHLSTHGARLEHGTAGQIAGHAAAASALAVAAVQVPPGGGAFDGTEEVEFFSSDGPRTIFFDAGGSPVGGRGASQSSVTREKPDLAAADGVSTTTPGFEIFSGTSAAVAHAAGIAALLRELVPSLTLSQARGVFDATALDIEAPGFDRDSGTGILDANAALQSAPNLFADGFESGNTSAWSSTLGG